MHESFNLETFQIPLREWIQQDQTKEEIKRRFRSFLLHYRLATGELVHERLIDEMCAANGSSLFISYLHLSQSQPILAIWLADCPKAMLELFREVARAVVLSRYSSYWKIASEISVRIKELPLVESLRDLRHLHLSALVKVSGVITRRSGIFPQLRLVYYNCIKCGAVSGPIQQAESSDPGAGSGGGGGGGAGGAGRGASGKSGYSGPCFDCQSKGPFTVNSEQTLYRNYQRMTLQESPGSVPPGRVPRTKEVVLTGDLIDCARPGEEVEVTAIYTHAFDASLNTRQGFPVFATLLEANHVDTKNDASAALDVSPEDKREIQRLASDGRIRERIVKSIAPSIYGHEGVKLAIALAMFGGREKNISGKHRIRGDINVLLLGDPGVAKSQFLKYVEKTAPRAVYTTGKGASAVGLTAAVHKDPLTGEWTLEGGALVLADRGVCLIDEFDKMNDQDRTSIHEAMEQQSISISKAGIVTTLQARCAVIAAANPIGGRYDISKTFSENVALTDPILTRFDVLCMMRDEVDQAHDERLATFVLDSHTLCHPDVQQQIRQRLNHGEGEKEAKIGALQDVGVTVSPGMLAGVASSGSSSALIPASSSSSSRGAGAGGAAGNGGASSSSAGPNGSGSSSSSASNGGSGASGVVDDLEPIPQALLKKYILEARSLKPSLSGIDQDKVPRLYAELRREAEISGGIPIAVRHIESIMRMSEASARMRLSSTVNDSDLNLAIRVMLESFISAQKYNVTRTLRRHFSRYLESGADYNQLLLVKLKEIVREKQALDFVRSRNLHGHGFDGGGDDDPLGGPEGGIEIKGSELVLRAKRHGVMSEAITGFFKSRLFAEQGFSFDAERGVIIKLLG